MYLTNALTGWESLDAAKGQVVQLQLFGLPELQQERDAATRIKCDAPVLVVLGNPPYNGYAGIAIDEERSLSNSYRTTKGAPAPQGQGLNDLYVRFFRMAERRIVEDTGRGVVLLPDLFPTSFPGIQTGRDDPAMSHAEMRRIVPGAMESTARFNAEQVRDYLRKRGFLPDNIVRFNYRPFDVRWLY